MPLAFDNFKHGHTTVVVKPGETAWTETIRAAKAARLIDPVAERTRPKVAGVLTSRPPTPAHPAKPHPVVGE